MRPCRQRYPTTTDVECGTVFPCRLIEQEGEKTSTEPTPSSTSVRFFFSFHPLPGRFLFFFFFSLISASPQSLGLQGDPPIWDSASPPRVRNPPKTTTAADLCVQDKGIIKGPFSFTELYTRRTTKNERKEKDFLNQHVLESCRLFGSKSALRPLLRLRVLCCRLKGASEARCCTVFSSVPLQQPSSS